MHLQEGRKHVFVDWELVEPGYNVAWGGATPASWEMPTGIELVTHSPRVDPEPIVVADRAYEQNLPGPATLIEDGSLQPAWPEGAAALLHSPGPVLLAQFA